jgi:hypothetical protein
MVCSICSLNHKNCVCVNRASLRPTLRGIPTPAFGNQAIKEAKREESTTGYSFVAARRRESKQWKELMRMVDE